MKNKVLNFILYILTYIITLFLVIGIDVWRFTLNWDDITWMFILNKSLIAILFTIISIITTLMVYDILEVKDEDYTTIDKVLKTEAIKLIGPKFNEAIFKLDWEEKKQAWRRFIDVKLFNHGLKAPNKVKEQLMTLDPSKYSRRTKRFINKENMFKEYLTLEWIDEKLYLQKINYEAIEPNEVLYGSRKNKEKKSKLVRNPLMKNIGLKISMIVPSLISTIIISILEQSGDVDYKGLSILIAGLILTLLINTLVGVRNGVTSHNLRLGNARERYSIMSNFKQGVYDKLSPVPKRKYERETEVIITEKIEEKVTKTASEENSES